MTTLILLFSALAAFTHADGGGEPCPEIGCGTNGTRTTGLTVELTDQVTSVALPSGEVIPLR